MASYVALLKAVNLGGESTMPMAALRRAVAGPPVSNVVTVRQSGNVLFDAGRRSDGAIERVLERRLAERFPRPVTVFVRSADAWQQVVAANPFPQAARQDPAHLLLAVAKGEPTAGGWARLRAAVDGREEFRPAPRALYLVYPDGVGRSTLTTARIERALGTTVTARNWNTVLLIADQLRR